MKIWIDMSHNPLRGYVSCTVCRTPLEHVDDSWHKDLANATATAMPHVPYDQNHPLNATPREFYPIMAQKAAEILAGRVNGHLYCRYCGKALRQPKFIGDVPVLPNVSWNSFKAVKKWADELELDESVPVNDMHKYNQTRYEQGKIGVVRFNN